MDLTTSVSTPTVIKRSQETLTLSAGDRLVIQRFRPDKTTDLDETVPVGKAWSVEVRLTIKETDG